MDAVSCSAATDTALMFKDESEAAVRADPAVRIERTRYAGDAAR